jgi:hypothetical protein
MAGTPTDRVRHALLGMLVRMSVAIGGGLALYLSVPGFERTEFWLWLIGFYLGTLALENVLLRHAPGVRSPVVAGTQPRQ